ncbi:glycoside hydrolase family 49 protein [Amniculicola lignicola CBS 123094]|uniref:Glycoside hydrolase family 49 protein n=1 Tax=Amniculicola lignicola CBS 123094 TaxID=1392246 RepID=A0A6A5W102_9PLEO|nr:glycoside hydrolase family 49 protein [Amniculicola lignicola CBS 123094]
MMQPARSTIIPQWRLRISGSLVYTWRGCWWRSITDMPKSYASFVYETIARSGHGNTTTPGDLSSTTNADDGVTIEAEVGITMAWTQFLHSPNSWTRVSRQSMNFAAHNAVVQPTTVNLTVRDDGEGNVYLLVPYRSHGIRFSVEFQDDLYAYENSCAVAACDFIQDTVPGSAHYVSPLPVQDHPTVAIEPHNALLVFPIPFPPPDLIPNLASPNTYTVHPESVPTLSHITNSVVYFGPGVHYIV